MGAFFVRRFLSMSVAPTVFVALDLLGLFYFCFLMAFKPDSMIETFYKPEEINGVKVSAGPIWSMLVNLMRMLSAAMTGVIVWVVKFAFVDGDVAMGLQLVATVISLFFVPMIYRVFLEDPSSPNWSSQVRRSDRTRVWLALASACQIRLTDHHAQIMCATGSPATPTSKASRYSRSSPSSLLSVSPCPKLDMTTLRLYYRAECRRRPRRRSPALPPSSSSSSRLLLLLLLFTISSPPPPPSLLLLRFLLPPVVPRLLLFFTSTQPGPTTRPNLARPSTGHEETFGKLASV
jgi:hypothetical protein